MDQQKQQDDAHHQHQPSSSYDEERSHLLATVASLLKGTIERMDTALESMEVMAERSKEIAVVEGEWRRGLLQEDGEDDDDDTKGEKGKKGNKK
jgi:hypothetical protein